MKFLQLYPEDFRKTQDWVAVCDQLSVPTSATSIELKISSVHYEEDENLEFNDNEN
jgi:hypothetical protein